MLYVYHTCKNIIYNVIEYSTDKLVVPECKQKSHAAAQYNIEKLNMLIVWRNEVFLALNINFSSEKNC